MQTSEITAMIAILGFLANVAVMIYGYGKLSQQVADLRQSREQNDRHHDEIFTMIRDFQLEATRKYVTAESLAAMKTDIITSLNRLADRVDRVLDGRGQHEVAGK